MFVNVLVQPSWSSNVPVLFRHPRRLCKLRRSLARFHYLQGVGAQRADCRFPPLHRQDGADGHRTGGLQLPRGQDLYRLRTAGFGRRHGTDRQVLHRTARFRTDRPRDRARRPGQHADHGQRAQARFCPLRAQGLRAVGEQGREAHRDQSDRQGHPDRTARHLLQQEGGERRTPHAVCRSRQFTDRLHLRRLA